jgi:hypothetical protein
VILIERDLSAPKRGVRHLGFDADLGSILLDLGIIDDSTDWEEIVALQKAPYAAFPKVSGSVRLDSRSEPPRVAIDSEISIKT